MATDQRERELKFDVPDEWQLPDPQPLLRAGGSTSTELQQLETTYYDTAAHDLLRTGITLRRRAGDADNGWHLKVPDGDARTEIRLPLTGRGVPAELRAITLGARKGAALKPVATVRTERAMTRLLDAAGDTLAEIVVDRVSATEFREFAVKRNWREVEVELVGGGEKLLARTAKWLVRSGAQPSASSSKLARALGVGPRGPGTPGGLLDLVRRYLAEQYEAILRGDIALRRGEDVIHTTRVATRRFRSVLRVFADLFDTDRALALDAELAWFAAGLGAVRDVHVLRDHLDSALAELPPELVLGPVAKRLHRILDADLAEAQEAVERLMRSKRYFALFRELIEWRDDLPVSDPADHADSPAAADVAQYLAGARRKVQRRLVAAADAEDRDLALHRARKAAKRARYTAELSVPELGKAARKAVKEAKTLQTRLGDRQDAVVASVFLLRAGAAAGTTAGENGFTFGLLYERELEHLRRVRR